MDAYFEKHPPEPMLNVDDGSYVLPGVFWISAVLLNDLCSELPRMVPPSLLNGTLFWLFANPTILFKLLYA
jgi:hypothetical protein